MAEDWNGLWPWGVVLPVGLVGWWLFRRPGQYFTWEEMTTTNEELPNEPTLADRIRLVTFTRRVLDPLRRAVGPLSVTSGFRSPEVNLAVGGATTVEGVPCHGGEGCSAHTTGYAADIYSSNYTNDEMAEMLYDGALDLPLSQVITYTDKTHLHLAYGTGPTEYLEHTPDGYAEWIA